MAIFCAVYLIKPGTTVILRNAKIDMFKGSIRLDVDKWGHINFFNFINIY